MELPNGNYEIIIKVLNYKFNINEMEVILLVMITTSFLC